MEKEGNREGGGRVRCKRMIVLESACLVLRMSERMSVAVGDGTRMLALGGRLVSDISQEE